MKSVLCIAINVQIHFNRNPQNDTKLNFTLGFIAAPHKAPGETKPVIKKYFN